jgi:hypothetical protein
MNLHGETEAIDNLPTSNPDSLDEILDHEFWPPEPPAQV